MVNQQKGVQQDTAYSGVIVSRPCLYHVSMTPLGKKRYRDGDTYDYSLQHYSTIGSILLHSILHPLTLGAHAQRWLRCVCVFNTQPRNYTHHKSFIAE